MGLFDWFRRRPAVLADADDDDEDQPDGEIDPAAPALTDELDLHTFQPRDCADLVDEYLHAAHAAGFSTVRIIHGKGKGTLRRIVHGVLDKHPLVTRYQLGDQRSGSWGATVVELASTDTRTG
ncbi:MAG TPA: Smr/MutS family protein [Kofleriaceae bacterium]|nr:Smr/MutS family protein [Kofleriaceae bacterium]